MVERKIERVEEDYSSLFLFEVSNRFLFYYYFSFIV